MSKGYMGLDQSTKRQKFYRGRLNLDSETFDELYADISGHWQEKAKRLQVRRWRKIKHQWA